MTNRARAFRGGCVVLMMLVGGAGSARAQLQTACDAASPKQLVTGTLAGFRGMGSVDGLGIAALGGVAALGAHSVDNDVTRAVAGPAPLGGTFTSGAVIGSTPFELGAAVAAYAIGHAFDKPCVGRLGADLIQAQVMAEVITLGLKEATRRSRPEGSGFSFPSGHTTVTFAAATVLQRHFGWKVGIPAYAVASYVGASRVEMNRHYLSDVAFGAALGIMVGRTIPVGRGHELMLAPMTSPSGGAGAALTWVGKR